MLVGCFFLVSHLLYSNWEWLQLIPDESKLNLIFQVIINFTTLNDTRKRTDKDCINFHVSEKNNGLFRQCAQFNEVVCICEESKNLFIVCICTFSDWISNQWSNSFSFLLVRFLTSWPSHLLTSTLNYLLFFAFSSVSLLVFLPNHSPSHFFSSLSSFRALKFLQS